MPHKIMWHYSYGHKIKIDLPEKSYTLGFLWGDGYLKHYKNKSGESNIHYPSLEITSEDLDQIKQLFEIWGRWILKYRERKNRKKIGSICLFDKEFGWFLKENDYMIKSYTEPDKILSLIPENLKQYWWRGFIDADGCFYKNKANQFSISGTYDQNWYEIIKLFEKLKIDRYQIQKRINKKSKSSAIRISNKIDIIKFGNYIYHDNLQIGLSRKYEKFNQIKIS